MINHTNILDLLLRVDDEMLVSNKHIIQYVNENILMNQAKMSNELITKMLFHGIDMEKCINIGTGPGVLEHVYQKKFNKPLLSVDLNDMFYNTMQRELGVERGVMTDIWSNDFSIKIKDRMDYGLIVRFVPINEHTDTMVKLRHIIKSIGKFVDTIISVEMIDNFYNVEVEEFLEQYKKDVVALNYSMCIIDVKDCLKKLDNIITQK